MIKEEAHTREINRVTKGSGSATAVKNISFKVSKEEISGHLGPSVTEKTMTIRPLQVYTNLILKIKTQSSQTSDRRGEG